MEADKPKRQIKWGQLAQGISVCTLALTCAGADIYNNAVFALEKSAVIAIAFVVAGAGLVLLPTMAKGRDIIIAFLVLVCGGLSLFAGYQNHMTSQRNHDLAEKAITERYGQSLKAIKAAEAAYHKAEADVEKISETTGSAELKVALDAASKLYEDNKAACGPVCKKAQKEMETLPDRIGKAKAKEDAQKRMSDALARWNSEKASAPKQAKAAGVSAAEENIMAVLLLLLTIGGATLTHRGWHLITTSVVIVMPAKIKRDPVAKPVVKQIAAPVETADGLKEFIAQCVTPTEGEPTTSTSSAHAALEDWWRIRQKGKPCPTAKAFGDAMTVAGIKRKKVKGRIHYQARLEKQHLMVVRVA
jgi:hypothetical protein